MSEEANKAVVQRLMDEVMNGNNLDAVDEIMADDYVNHDTVPGLGSDREGFKQLFAGHHAAFPDLKVVIDDIVAEGDKVANRWSWTGTHKGPFMGVPATGKHVTLTGISIHRFADGKIIEQWHRMDMLGMMQQMGVVPKAGE